MPWHRLDGRLLNSHLDLPAREDLPVGDAWPAAAKPLPRAERVPPRSFERPRRRHLPVRAKFVVALAAASAWLALSAWLARFWVNDLSAVVGPPLAWMAICGIALIPGFMNAFLAASLLLDRRPKSRSLHRWPPLSILIAAFNERESIATTLDSIARSRYSGPLDVILVDDGSTDGTAAIAASKRLPWLRVLRQPCNLGKAAALNRGLGLSRHPLVVTIDADSRLHPDALQRLVGRYLSDPPSTRAVAGAILVGNSRTNWITRAQEWDYFNGIAAVKRVQSLYQGTLVAQGAFSIYDRATLIELGGWPSCVGEDIVLTWSILDAGWRVGHAEDACCFTRVPESLPQFIRQRQRWARGMIEAFDHHPQILFVPRLSTLFIWWNLLFPWLDIAYTLFFLPGLVLGMLGIYWIAGPMTLFLLPLSLLMNALMFRIESAMFTRQGLHVRRNVSGFLLYAFAYGAILQPACVWGYVCEIAKLRKSWGTK